jgi:L-amino acid N-acyltransferase YncA
MKKEFLQNLPELKITNGYEILLPTNFPSIEEKILWTYAQQVSQLIDQLGNNHMFPVLPEKAMERFRKQMSVLLVTGNSVVGHISYFPWLQNNNPVGFEVGSLVVAEGHQGKNFGKILVAQMGDYLRSLNTGLPIISVVVEDNLPSINVFTRLGWRAITHQQSIELFQGVDILDEWPYPSKIFICP